MAKANPIDTNVNHKSQNITCYQLLFPSRLNGKENIVIIYKNIP